MTDASPDYDELLRHAMKMSLALQDLTPGGSEYVARVHDGLYLADVDACATYIREQRNSGQQAKFDRVRLSRSLDEMLDRAEKAEAERNTADEALSAMMDRAAAAEAEAARLREALDTIAGFAKIDMRGCYERELRDIIRSMTDRARALTGGDHG